MTLSKLKDTVFRTLFYSCYHCGRDKILIDRGGVQGYVRERYEFEVEERKTLEDIVLNSGLWPQFTQYARKREIDMLRDGLKVYGANYWNGRD